MTTLTPAEFFTCWRALALGETPPLLQVRPPGFTMADHRRILADTESALRSRGMWTADGPEPGLRAMLDALARPDYTLDVRYAAGPHTHVLGLGAVNGPSATIVTSDGTGDGPLDLDTVDTAYLPARLLDLVGPITPGRGSPVNIPVDALDAAHHPDVWTVADRLHARGVPRADASAFARMCTDIQAGGQLGATVHLGGPPRRAPWVIGLHRTPTGHFLQLRRHRTLTIHPATPALLLTHWQELTP